MCVCVNPMRSNVKNIRFSFLASIVNPASVCETKNDQTHQKETQKNLTMKQVLRGFVSASPGARAISLFLMTLLRKNVWMVRLQYGRAEHRF
jgi:hypothetical protein